MGALVDPSRFTSKNHIEQKNLTPRVRLSDAKQEEKNSASPPPQSTTPKVIVAPAIKRSTNTYSEVTDRGIDIFEISLTFSFGSI